MSLKLGKDFNRSYSIRIPIFNGFYNITSYFNKNSSFLLFDIFPDFNDSIVDTGAKINTFKNLQQSKFCESFINLHNYRKNNLDILNQYDSIKEEYVDECRLVFNETIQLSKSLIEDNNKVFYDTCTFYGFQLTDYINEFIFIIAERQNINKSLKKKIVRTTGIQISNSQTILILDEYLQKENLKKIQNNQDNLT